MLLTEQEFTTYSDFIFSVEDDLAQNCVRAFLTYMDGGTNEDYVIIEVKGYYAVTKVLNPFFPIKVSTLVQPFDKTKVYPLQKIKKEINFVY